MCKLDFFLYKCKIGHDTTNLNIHTLKGGSMVPIKFDIVPFDYTYLINHPSQKANLLRFYCEIWRNDPVFAEYSRCPNCRKFFSKDDVEIKLITSCSGTASNPHKIELLEDGWTPEIADIDLQKNLALGKDFFGAIAVTPPRDQIIGFVWGYTIDFAVLSNKWPQNTVSKVNQELPGTKVSYFAEVASHPVFRDKGVGKALCKVLISWMKQNYPSIPSMLHTHEDSKAFHIYQKAGYRLFDKVGQINSGRILMAAKQCSILTPENL